MALPMGTDDVWVPSMFATPVSGLSGCQAGAAVLLQAVGMPEEAVWVADAAGWLAAHRQTPPFNSPTALGTSAHMDAASKPFYMSTVHILLAGFTTREVSQERSGWRAQVLGAAPAISVAPLSCPGSSSLSSIHGQEIGRHLPKKCQRKGIARTSVAATAGAATEGTAPNTRARAHTHTHTHKHTQGLLALMGFPYSKAGRPL